MNLSLIGKVGVIIRYIFSSFLSIEIFIISLLLLCILLINIKRKNTLVQIAAIGILVAVLQQVLARAGREDQAMMTTLAGLVIVLTMVIKEISTLFSTVRTIFSL